MAARRMRTVAVPTHASATPRKVDIEAAYKGAELLGFTVTPQGERIARLLEARVPRKREPTAMYSTLSVQVGRRASKTTSIWQVILGRALTRPGYRCVTTAQTGTVASRILSTFGEVLERNGHGGYAPHGSRGTSSGDGTMRLLRNSGRERLEFENGSAVWCVPPEAGAVRSEASDDILVDEAGELDPIKGADFLDGVSPLMDTRGPLAQLIITGTPGKARLGPYWDELEAGRLGKGRHGTLNYCAADDDDPDDEGTWLRVHPGIGTLTTLETIRERRENMRGGLAAFAREYLCLWPTSATHGALDTGKWKAAGVERMPLRPPHLALGFHASKDQSVAAVVAAWRDDEDRACVEVLAYRPGVSWVADFVHDIATAARVPVAFDDIGGNVTVAADLRRRRRPATLVQLTLKEVVGACQLIADAVRERRVQHYQQPDLTSAVEAAAWRPAGRDGRAFMARPGMGDIVTLQAAAWALWAYDKTPARRGLTIVEASA